MKSVTVVVDRASVDIVQEISIALYLTIQEV